MVLGSYAHFMWEADEDEEKEMNGKLMEDSGAMIVACQATNKQGIERVFEGD